MIKQKQYITWEQYNQLQRGYSQLKKEGVEFIHTINKIKLVSGLICLAVAIVPNGLGIIFYPLSFSLLASSGINYYTIMEDKKRRFRVFLQNLKRMVRK